MKIGHISSGHVWMWKLDYKESWPKNWYFWTVVLEKTLESPLDCKEIQPVHPKGNHSWIFIGRTDAETPILWPPDEALTYWQRPWCWEWMKMGGEGDDRGWDGWMVSPAQWVPEKHLFLPYWLCQSPWHLLGCKEIKPVNPKGNHSWIFIGRTDIEAPLLWPPDVKSQLIGKDPEAGKDWRQKEKGISEDETVGWHQWLNGHEFSGR